MVKGASSLAEGTLQPCTLFLASLFLYLLNSETRADHQKCCPISNSSINNAIRIKYYDFVSAIFVNHNVGCGICYIH